MSEKRKEQKKAFIRLKKGVAQATHFLELAPATPLDVKVETLSQAADETKKEGEKPLPPNPDDYVQKDFRLLSAIIIPGARFPIDYTRPGVLESAVHKFRRTLFTDHWHWLNDCVGSVRFPRWNASSKPPGVDGTLFVLREAASDRKRDIAKLVGDGHIDRCSVTIVFAWEQSHLDMKEKEFWLRIGETDEKGELIRIIVTEVIDIYEVSLVYFGADNTAGGHDLDEVQYSADDSPEMESAQCLQDETSNKTKEVTNVMKEKFEAIKAKLAGYLGKVFETELEVVQGVEQLIEEVAALKTEKTALETQVTGLTKSKGFLDKLTEELRAAVIRLATAFGNGKLDAHEEDLYKQAPYEKLESYKAALENKVPLKCENCGHTVISRRSSIEAPLGPPVPGSGGKGKNSQTVRLTNIA